MTVANMPNEAEINPFAWIYDPSVFTVDTHKAIDRRGLLNLSSNHLLHGASDALLTEALTHLTSRHVSEYAYHEPFVDRLAIVLKTKPQSLTLTAGADDAIKILSFALLRRGKVALAQKPGYGANYLMLNAEELHYVEYDQSSFDLKSMAGSLERHRPNIVLISNPNSPTGFFWSKEDLSEIYECTRRFGTLLVIDETYLSFAGALTHESFEGYPGVVRVGSFSKGWGMAGARLGYIIAEPSLTSYLKIWNSRNPVSQTSLVVADYLLGNKDVFIGIHRDVASERDKVARDLITVLGKEHVIRGNCNFVTFRMRNAKMQKELLKEMLSHKIVLKDLDGVKGLDLCVRITVGDQQVNSRALPLLFKLLRTMA